MRLSLIKQSFDFDIHLKKGTENILANALSRVLAILRFCLGVGVTSEDICVVYCKFSDVFPMPLLSLFPRCTITRSLPLTWTSGLMMGRASFKKPRGRIDGVGCSA